MSRYQELREMACRTIAKRLFGLVFAAVLLPATSNANELSGSVTLYGWLPWIDMEATTQSGATATTSLSGEDVLETLEGAFMAAGEIRYGRFGLLHDTIYSKLANDGTTTGPFSASVEVEMKMLMATTALGYQVYAKDGAAIELFAGARYVDIETEVSLQGGGPLGLGVSADVEESWVDPIIGIRGRMPITKQLSYNGFVDIGGFGAGSDFTWEFFSGLEYAFNDRFSVNGGFRYIFIDYDTGSVDLDLDLYGPVIGGTLRF